MRSLVEIPGKEMEIAFFGAACFMVALLVFGAWYMSPLDQMDALFLAAFAFATASTFWSAFGYRWKRLAKVNELERLENVIHEAIRSNG